MFYSMLLSWTEMREIVFWYLLTLALCDAAITYHLCLFNKRACGDEWNVFIAHVNEGLQLYIYV